MSADPFFLDEQAALRSEDVSLLTSERVFCEPPAELRATVRARVQGAIHQHPSVFAPSVRAPWIRAAACTALLGLGTTIGWFAHEAVQGEHALPARTERRAEEEAGSIASLKSQPVAATTTVAPPPIAPVDQAPSRPSPHMPRVPTESLALERALLDNAHTALRQGNAREAFAFLERHRRQTPGRLAEERQAMEIETLLALGNPDGARALASNFHTQYPNSLLWPRIVRALED